MGKSVKGRQKMRGIRGTVRRLAVTAMAALTLGGGLTFATAGPAAAGGWGCSGSEVSGSPYAVKDDNGNVFSWAHLYYDSSSGQNCAVNVKVPALSGTPSHTYVNLEACAETSPASNCTRTAIDQDPTDSRLYSQFAGPVRVNAQGHCISLWAETFDNDTPDRNHAWYWSGRFGNAAFHCG
ncbi:hypothetical protein GCM10010430_13870 [Kitasatospora cystarginea]|uniref:Spore-associated protein A n=2 Tax=Kitasatospora cystarginea TaxID=58350 RepID=A0ABP5QFI8_9ACTN